MTMAKSPVPDDPEPTPPPAGEASPRKRKAVGGKIRKRADEQTVKTADKGGGGRSVAKTIPPAGKTKAGAKAPAKGARKASDRPAVRKAKAPHGKTNGKKPRLLPRKAFLVAATLHDGEAVTGLRVYAAVVRSAEAALAAVRTEIGEAATVELTGSLSTRMAKTLGLTADEIRQI